eukprot:750865-Hanusia_phi.AAC.4
MRQRDRDRDRDRERDRIVSEEKELFDTTGLTSEYKACFFMSWSTSFCHVCSSETEEQIGGELASDIPALCRSRNSFVNAAALETLG